MWNKYVHNHWCCTFVKNLPENKPLNKNEWINKKQDEAKEKEEKLKIWRNKVAKKKEEVEDLQKLVDEAISLQNKINTRINQINDNMDSNITDIEYFLRACALNV